MTETASQSSPFRRRSVEQVFMSNPSFLHSTANVDQEPSPESQLPDIVTKKKQRRAQVRKAQTEHRQRKENYIQQLEQNVVSLRDSIATIAAEASTIEKENEAIHAALDVGQILARRSTPQWIAPTRSEDTSEVSQPVIASDRLPYKSS